MSKKDDKNGKASIVIRKEEVIEGGHHGGAWKVAYADFVTAMMAFFLLMWLLNATTETQRKGLADYFSPSNILSQTSSGVGKPFAGETPYEIGNQISDKGAMTVINGPQEPQPDVQEDDTLSTKATPLHAGDGSDANSSDSATGNNGAQIAYHKLSRAELAVAAVAAAAAERQSFQSAASEIRQAIASDPGLGDLGRQLAVDMTPEGLRIQIMDGDKNAMFATGSDELAASAKKLLAKVLPVLKKLAEPISIAGYTDARPYANGDRSNWELSADRANATRRFLESNGLAPGRIAEVTGNADRQLLLPGQPLAAANRRVAIVVLRQAGLPARNAPESLNDAASSNAAAPAAGASKAPDFSPAAASVTN